MRKWIVLVVVGIFSVTLVACGGIDNDKLEDEISSDAETNLSSAGLQVTVESVSCPDDIESETGTEFECDVSLSDGTSAIANGEITDGESGEFEATFEPAE